MKRLSKTAEEKDAVTGWRHVLSWRRGELRRVKNRMNRRERREARRELRWHE